VQVPHVSSAAVAREAVKAVRYPPEGERGMAAGSRAANFGKTPLLEHMAQSNKEVLLACMIEDMEAVEQIEEIAAVDGVDLLAVGPSDLSRSLGVSGHPDHPKLGAAINRVRAAVRNGSSVRLAIPLNRSAFPRNGAVPDPGAALAPGCPSNTWRRSSKPRATLVTARSKSPEPRLQQPTTISSAPYKTTWKRLSRAGWFRRRWRTPRHLRERYTGTAPDQHARVCPIRAR